MPVILDHPLYDEMLAAADLAGATRINARASWLRENVVDGTIRPDAIRRPCRVAKLRCSPPPCVELWAVDDDSIPSDWQVAE